VENRAALDAIVAGFFLTKTRAQLEPMLRGAAIAYGAVNSVETFAEHPQLRRTPVTLENGETAHLVAAPVQHSFEPSDPTFGRVPALGEHSVSIRHEFAGQLLAAGE